MITLKTSRIRKGEYKLEYKDEIIFAIQRDNGTWGLYEDSERENWVDFFRRTDTLKSCKNALIFMVDSKDFEVA